MRGLTTHERSPLARFGLRNDEFDRAFEGFFQPIRWLEEATSETLMPAMDIRETEDAYIVKTDLPGVKKEDINVTMENGVLTISAESNEDREKKEGERVIRRERHYGKYSRSLRLGTHVDNAKVRASYKDGVLELILPKAEAVKPKKISVDVA